MALSLCCICNILINNMINECTNLKRTACYVSIVIICIRESLKYLFVCQNEKKHCISIN